MTEYAKDTRFSAGWMVGGTAIILVTYLFGLFILSAAGVTSIWIALAVALGCFGAGGFVVGWQSEGRTIIEAGIAAINVVLIVFVINGFNIANPIALALGSALPFGAAVLGAFLGELVQGNTIRRDD